MFYHTLERPGFGWRLRKLFSETAAVRWRFFTCWAALIGSALVCALFLATRAIGWWIDFSEEPVRSDIIVPLAGSFLRPIYAADLYHQGYAPEVWLDQPLHYRPEELVRQLNIPYPYEKEVNRKILIKKGVPKSKIHPFGDNINSTTDEALALRREFNFGGKKILIVTSRFHARRARLIFRHYLPGAQIRVVATPYDDFDRRWWRHKELALDTVTEMGKLFYYLCGLNFVKQP